MTGQPDKLFLDFQAAVAGRYSLEREVGRGGMGVVYLAREVRLDRPVAIKLLPPGRAADAALRDRFLREARTAAKLSHPNILPVYTVDEVGEFVFFAMAFLDGETLTERVQRRGPLLPADAAKMLRELAWALAYAHAQGVIHRDVKPDNILLEAATGRALMADFGIAAAAREETAGEGAVVTGTPEFMSPEQALGERLDGRSDLYALGLVGFFALTGRLAFRAADTTELLAKQVGEAAPTLLDSGRGVPRKLAYALDRCLAKDPAVRPQKGEELAEALSSVLDQRREIPVPLRVFVKRSARVGIGAFLYLYVVAGTFGLLFGLAGVAVGWTSVVGLLLGVPLAAMVLRARRMTQLGFGREDVVAAFEQDLEQNRDERTFEWGHGPGWYERAMRLLAAAGLSVGLVGALIGASGGVIGTGVAVGIGGGLLALLRLSQRRDLSSETWLWFWRSRLGRWVFKLAGRPRADAAIAAGATHRPTELALGLAAGKLYAGLPKATQKELRDLPGVVKQLEGDARRMRRRLDELNDAVGAADRPRGAASDDLAARRDRVLAELREERDLVQQRLADAVAALETIRLNLLKLHAGSGSVAAVTTDLGLAREVAREVDLLLSAQREVEDAL